MLNEDDLEGHYLWTNPVNQSASVNILNKSKHWSNI